MFGIGIPELVIIAIIVLLLYLHKKNKNKNDLHYYSDTTKNNININTYRHKSFFDDYNWDSSFNFNHSSNLLNDDDINPANGLPMIGCVDIEGNPYGTDLNDDDF